MVSLLGENTLLLMRPGDRGQLVPQLLEQVKNMPREVKPGLVKVKVSSEPNRQGQVNFTLPSGKTFQASPTQPLPQGSTVLIQVKPDGKPPQVLRVILPAQNGQQNTLQQTSSPSVLMAVAKQAQPKVGQNLQLTPAPLPGTKAGQGQLPTPGAQVLGQVQTPPSGGSQNLLLANRTPLLLSNPPVFEVGSQLTLRITGMSSAVLEKIMPPAPKTPMQTGTPQSQQQLSGAGQSSQSQGIQGRPATPQLTPPPQQPAGRGVQPQGTGSTLQGGQTPVAQAGTGQPTSPLLQLRPLAPVPQQIINTPLTVTVSAVEANTLTLRTENGLEFKVQPVSRQGGNKAQQPLPQTAQQPAEQRGQPQGQQGARDGAMGSQNQGAQRPEGQSQAAQSQAAPRPQSQAQASGQTATSAIKNGSTMSVRFTENGLLDVLQVAEPRNKLGSNISQRREGQGGNQTGGQNPGNQNQAPPQGFQSGHIATGTVSQQKPDGRLVLQFERGITVEVQAQRLLPVGSKISIQIMPDGHAEIIDMSLPRGTERSNTLMRFAVSWEGLQNAFDELSRSNPDAHRKMANTLPRANESLLPQLIQFSNAVAQQNLQAMLGDELVNILRALGLDGMLQSDLSQMNAVQQQRPDNPDSWRALLFPYWDEQEGQAKQGGFYWRRQHQDDAEDAGPDEGTLRFVLNVQMSELGHTQLDGLMQEHESLYLKLRTQYALSDDEKAGLRRLVSKSLDALGLEGQVVIQQAGFFDVDPLHDILRAEGGEFGQDPINQVNVEA